MHSPVPSGQRRKLAMGYTEHMPGGGTTKHPSPDVLWETDSLYPQYVEERARYWRGQGGSDAQRRSKLVNQLGAYKGNKYAWLEWRAARVPEFDESQLTGGRMEAV